MRIELDKERQKRLTQRYWRLIRTAFVKCRQGVVDMSEHTDPGRLKVHVSTLMNPKPMKELILQLWSEVGGEVGQYIEVLLTTRKSKSIILETKAPKKSDWNDKMKIYASERSLKKVESIMTTEQEAINKVIDSVIQESLDEGLGIIDTRRLLTRDLEGEEMLSMENWQAQRIAMTEVGSAQNTASFMAAQENSEGVKKLWMFIPGLKTFREEHKQYEEDGPQDMDYDYDTVDGGLQYPGDPDGTAEQVINCYCSIGYEVD